MESTSFMSSSRTLPDSDLESCCSTLSRKLEAGASKYRGWSRRDHGWEIQLTDVTHLSMSMVRASRGQAPLSAVHAPQHVIQV